MIILSIPFLDEKFVEKQFEKFRNPFDLIEFRLDFNENYKSFPIDLINPKTIITIKDYAVRIEFEKKIDFLAELTKKFGCLVDLEIEKIDFSNPINLFVEIPSQNLILSFHDFSQKTDFNKIENIVAKSNLIPSKFLKIAVNISTYSDLLEISRIIKKSEKPVIFAGMGKLGKISRILYNHLNAEATFVGLENHKTAAAQLTVAETERYNLKFIDKNTKIGGIVGGEQIEKSLGLKFYNEYFRKNNLNAVYIPFIVNKLEDFLNWVRNSKLDFFGFSVTMPHKKEIGKYFSQKQNNSPVNLYIPSANEFFNTDFIAFQKAIRFLKIKTSDKILIFGNGATAETALNALADFSSVFLSSENKERGKFLSQKYGRKFIPKDDLSVLTFDLTINCTPLGMNGEDFLKYTNLKFPAKIIDLPYGNEKTPLIRKCEEKKILFADGKMFWKWQAEIQLQKFVANIK